MNKSQWLEKLAHWKNKWSQFLPEYENDLDNINMYKFVQILNKYLKNDSVIVSDAGSVGYVLAQSLELKENQRYLPDAGQMAMAAWPMAIGVCLANDKKQTIVCTGDGSFNSAIPALSTIIKNNLNIKIFIWQNQGYLSIKNTCDAFYDKRRFGTDSSNGLHFPDIEKIAIAYGFSYFKCDKIIDLDYIIKKTLKFNDPTLCEIVCDPNQKIIPGLAMKNGKSTTLDDMSPYLSAEEMNLETIKD